MHDRGALELSRSPEPASQASAQAKPRRLIFVEALQAVTRSADDAQADRVAAEGRFETEARAWIDLPFRSMCNVFRWLWLLLLYIAMRRSWARELEMEQQYLALMLAIRKGVWQDRENQLLAADLNNYKDLVNLIRGDAAHSSSSVDSGRVFDVMDERGFGLDMHAQLPVCCDDISQAMAYNMIQDLPYIEPYRWRDEEDAAGVGSADMEGGLQFLQNMAPPGVKVLRVADGVWLDLTSTEYGISLRGTSDFVFVAEHMCSLSSRAAHAAADLAQYRDAILALYLVRHSREIASRRLVDFWRPATAEALQAYRITGRPIPVVLGNFNDNMVVHWDAYMYELHAGTALNNQRVPIAVLRYLLQEALKTTPGYEDFSMQLSRQPIIRSRRKKQGHKRLPSGAEAVGDRTQSSHSGSRPHKRRASCTMEADIDLDTQSPMQC